jgi:glycerol-3-phosphate acyltransferase PlsX
MGSDKAPRPEIEGALQAARHHGAHVLLVGPEARLQAELAHYPGARRLPVEVVHASDVITMDDKVEAIRAKRDSSIRVGLRLVREGRAAGFVTAGNTGAAMATAKMVLGALPGVDRPALAAAFPTVLNTAAVLLDVGANVDCEAMNLEQFAVMGDIYCRDEASACWPAFDWGGRRQRQHSDTGSISVAQTASNQLHWQRRRTRPL